MKAKPIKDLPASIHQRLLNKAKAEGRPFNEVLQYFAMERFLYRLSKSPHADKFVLKGALMLTAWKAPQSRSTMDIDLLGRLKDDVKVIIAAMKDVCRQEVVPDGLMFDAVSVKGEVIAEQAEYEGVRIRLQGRLGNARITIQVDIGFGDSVVPKPVGTSYPVILDLPAPKLQGYTRESAVAEKFEAMVRLGMLNSRMKDFYDIWLLSRTFEFDGATLAKAIGRTFKNRGASVSSDPVALTKEFADAPAKQSQWRGFLRRNRLKDAPQELREIIQALAAFLGPVAASLQEGKPFSASWRQKGPWTGA